MDEPDRTASVEPDRTDSKAPDRSPAGPTPEWVAALPPPPFVDPGSEHSEPRFTPISPRVAVLIGLAIVIGILFWMARDAVRPFIFGLLMVYLLDPPVRWLARRGIRRTFAILIVYVIAVILFVEFLNLTFLPLVEELVRLLEDLPGLAAQLQTQADRLGEFYERLAIPEAVSPGRPASSAGCSAT